VARTCPTCDGEKIVFVFADGHRADGSPIHDNGPRKCSTCAGTGEITDEHAERITEGQRMRLERIGNGLTLREAAHLAGTTPAKLSALEQGRIPEGTADAE